MSGYVFRLYIYPRCGNKNKPNFGEVFMNEKESQAKPIDCDQKMDYQGRIFLSIAELMMCTGLSRSSINRQIKTGNIPIARIGNRILIPNSYLEALQTATETTTKGAKG
jgi:hypothetical protein